MPPRLLLVEDDDLLALPLEAALRREGYEVGRAGSGEEALTRHEGAPADLILLDVDLPGINGLEVCRRVRDRDDDVRIIMLTARRGELDQVVGLDVGADDYVAKPFALGELLARVRANLRRLQADRRRARPATATDPAGLRVDRSSRRVFVNGEEVELSTKEFDLLAALASAPGEVRSRGRLMEEVWDERWIGPTKTLDVTVGRLRQKLREADAPVRVTAVRGVGYRLDTPTVES